MMITNQRSSPPGSSRIDMFGRPRFLMATEGGGGSGGGAGGGTGTGGGEGLNQAAIDHLNAIVSSRLQKFDFSGLVNTAVEKAMSGVTEKLGATVSESVAKAIAAAGTPAGGAGDKGKDKGKGAEQDPETANKLASLESSLAALKADNQKKDQAIAEAAARAKAKTVDDRFKSSLTELKVRPELADAAQLAIAKRAGEITWENDEPRIKVKRDKHGHQFEETISPEDFAKEWADTKEGKGFLPAPKGGPTQLGNRGGGTVINRGGGQQQQGQQGGQQQARRPAGPSDMELGNMVIAAYGGGAGSAGDSD